MAGIDDSVVEALDKLDEHREQLALVEKEIKDNGEQPHLVKIKNDLMEVISYIEDLVRYKNATAANAGPAAGATKSRPKAGSSSLIDRTCEVYYENKWYNATVRSLRKDERGVERATVAILGLGIKREYKTGEIRLLKPPPPVQCQPGTAIQAIFTEDGLWYPAQIVEQTSDGYKIQFEEVEDPSEVAFDQIRLATKKEASSSKDILEEAKRKNINIVVTPGGYRVPENLLPKETDTDKQKENKRRKLHALKQEQRKEREERESQTITNSWQKFKVKSSTKSKTGFRTGKAKDSIFKSPDGVGGKVGVVNSGKSMTTFGERQRHVREQ